MLAPELVIFLVSLSITVIATSFVYVASFHRAARSLAASTGEAKDPPVAV